MIKTYKEIETKNGTKLYFYDENDILIATTEEWGIVAIRELTEEEFKMIQEIIN